jgi:hypothetical protein
MLPAISPSDASVPIAGGPVAYFNAGNPDVWIYVGSLDHPEDWPMTKDASWGLTEHVYVDEKIPWYEISDGLPQRTSIPTRKSRGTRSTMAFPSQQARWKSYLRRVESLLPKPRRIPILRRGFSMIRDPIFSAIASPRLIGVTNTRLTLPVVRWLLCEERPYVQTI